MRDENFSLEEILKAFETAPMTRMDPQDLEQYELAKIIIRHALGEIPDSEIAPFCSPTQVTNIKPIAKFSEGYLFKAETDLEDEGFTVWIDNNVSTTASSIEDIETFLAEDIRNICQLIQMKAHTEHPYELPEEAKLLSGSTVAKVKLTWRDFKRY